MRSYGIARFLYNMLSALCWLVMVFGCILAAAGIVYLFELNPLGRPSTDFTVFLGALPGLFICLMAFFGLVFVQNARTSVDVAEYTQQVLKATRDHMEISRQAVTQGQRLEQGFAQMIRAAGLDPTPAMPASADYAAGGEGRSDARERTGEEAALLSGTDPSFKEPQRDAPHRLNHTDPEPVPLDLGSVSAPAEARIDRGTRPKRGPAKRLSGVTRNAH